MEPTIPPSIVSTHLTSSANKVYVFDFDCTLTVRHFYYFINRYDDFKKLYINNFYDILYERLKSYYGLDGESLKMKYKTYSIQQLKLDYPDLSDEQINDLYEKTYNAHFRIDHLHNIYSKYFNTDEADEVEEEYTPADEATIGDIDNPQNPLNIEELIKLIFGDNDRIKNLKTMFVQIGELKLYIASRGRKLQILKLLQLIGLRNLILSDNVSGWRKKKVDLLTELFKRHNVFYADDDHAEHNYFLDNYILADSLGKVIADNWLRIIASRETSTYTHYYTFYTALKKDIGEGIPSKILLSIATNNAFETIHLLGGSKNYYKSYMKYKNKYLQLKNTQ
jgi:hypothetical protein